MYFIKFRANHYDDFLNLKLKIVFFLCIFIKKHLSQTSVRKIMLFVLIYIFARIEKY